MKVCHLASGDLWAGAEVQIFNMVRSLKAYNALKLSAIILNRGKLAEELERIGVEVTIIDESKFSFSELKRMIADQLKQSPVDLIHSHRLKENILAGLMKRAGLVKALVKTVHGLPEPAGFVPQLKTRVYRAYENYLTHKSFDMTLPVSDDINRALAGKIEGSRLQTIHNAIDREQLTITRTPAEIKAELGLSPETILIGSAGRMVPVKGYERFIATAAIMLKTKPDLKFVMAGDGPLLDSLKAQVKVDGLSEQIIFTGYRDDIIDLMNSMTLFWVTSYHEGIPMVVLEGMALGVSVVGFDVGGLSEIITSGESGLLVEPGDCNALAQVSLELLDDRSRKDMVTVTAKKRIDEAFSSQSQSLELKRIYERVMAS